MQTRELTCIGCPLGCQISVSLSDEGTVETITGNTCPRGEAYAREEVTAPARTVTSTVAVSGGDKPRCSVKTAQDIPKGKIFDVMTEIDRVRAQAPLHIGDVVLRDVCDTGVDVIATRNIAKG